MASETLHILINALQSGSGELKMSLNLTNKVPGDASPGTRGRGSLWVRALPREPGRAHNP